MPVYEFVAKSGVSNDPNRPAPVVRGLLHLPGSLRQFTRDQVVGYLQQYRVLTPGVTYSIREVMPTDPPVVCIQVGQAIVSRQHVSGGQPVGVPQAQRGGDRQDSPVEPGGFQTLGDGALGADQDTMYGEPMDGTWSDIVVNPVGGSQEIPRP